jgi:hypothetical protein
LFTTNSSQVASADVLGQQILSAKNGLCAMQTKIGGLLKKGNAAPSTDEHQSDAGIGLVMLIEVNLCSLSL